MAYKKGVRIWRYRGGNWIYRRSSSQFDQEVDPMMVKVPDQFKWHEREDDWLFEQVDPTQPKPIANTVDRIPSTNVLFLLHDSDVPKDADVYF
ncbi:MAG: hypothetical protein AAFX00_09560 [Pseudomonadota bacterium]